MKQGRSKSKGPGGVVDVPLVAMVVAMVAAAAVWYHLRHGYLLYFGDAQAHLAVARRVMDSRTPGFDQIGTVWLPLPHLLMMPFVGNDAWWRNGLAGAIPGAACFTVAAAFLYAAVRRLTYSRAAAGAAAALFALNPNMLYLQATPMTEPVFFACLMALLYATVWYRDTGSVWAVLLGAVGSMGASWTRYEGWFLIPFVGLYFALAGKRRRFGMGILFGILAAVAPAAWLAHNVWYYGDPLAFYHGPYSAKAIYQRALDAGMDRYPGDHDWGKAWLQFRSAVALCAGGSLVVLGVAGIAAALYRRMFWAVAFLSLPVVFYVLSIYSSGTPIFVPHLWPNSYYNTRYGLAALPLLAVCAAALVAVVPGRFRAIAAVLVVTAATIPWLVYPRPEAWITWKESQVNSEARRAWTREAAEFLKSNYRMGDGIYSTIGDVAGVFREAGIPFREVLQEGNNPHWDAAGQRPDLFLWETWAVAISGDDVSASLLKTPRRQNGGGGEKVAAAPAVLLPETEEQDPDSDVAAGRGAEATGERVEHRRMARPIGPRYKCVKMITVKGGPAIEIYRRQAGIP